MFAEGSNTANNLTKESAVRSISETQICPKQGSITLHETETYLNLWYQEANTDDWIFTELLRTHTAYICVPVTSWRMMKPSQNGVLLLQSQPYLQKGTKCESGQYRPVSSLGPFLLSPWNFQDRRGINPLKSISILAWEVSIWKTSVRGYNPVQLHARNFMNP